MTKSNHFDYFGVPLTGTNFKIFENLEKANLIQKESELAKYCRLEYPNTGQEPILGGFFEIEDALGFIYFNSDGLARSIMWSIPTMSEENLHYCINKISSYYTVRPIITQNGSKTYFWKFDNGDVRIILAGPPHGIVLCFEDKINNSVDQYEEYDYDVDDEEDIDGDFDIGF